MAIQIQLRNDAAANWTSANPTLAAGEIGVETDTGLLKIGDGITTWTSLGYFTPDVNGVAAQIIDSAPATLDTLNELAAALGDDANFAANVTNSLALKAPLDSPTFTGTVSGTVSSTSAADIAASSFGFRGIPSSSAGLSGSYTLVASDSGELVYSTATRTVTIPANSAVPFEVGTSVVFVSGPATTTTIEIISDTLILANDGSTGSRTLDPHGIATALKVDSTTWYISGNGLS